MKKYVINEKGVTLIELLGALALASIIISVVTMTFLSVNQEWNQSTQKYNNDAQARSTMHHLADMLTDSVIVYVTTEEVRFQPGAGGLKALKYESQGLILYDYAATSIEAAGSYSNPVVLATNVASSPTVQYVGAEHYMGSISAGKLFTLTIPFLYSITDVHGGTTDVIEDYTITIKLFAER